MYSVTAIVAAVIVCTRSLVNAVLQVLWLSSQGNAMETKTISSQALVRLQNKFMFMCLLMCFDSRIDVWLKLTLSLRHIGFHLSYILTWNEHFSSLNILKNTELSMQLYLHVCISKNEGR